MHACQAQQSREQIVDCVYRPSVYSKWMRMYEYGRVTKMNKSECIAES